MMPDDPHLPQHLLLAQDRHQRLLEEAQRHRMSSAAGESPVGRPVRWQRLRVQVGDLLINAGHRLKADASGTVWG